MKTWVSYTGQGCLPRIWINQIPAKSDQWSRTFEVMSNRELGPYPGYSYCPAVQGKYAVGTDLPFYDPKPEIPEEVKTLVRPLFLTDRLRWQLREAIGVLPTKFARLMVRDLRVVDIECRSSDFNLVGASRCSFVPALSLWAAILGSDDERVCRTEEVLDL